MNQPDKTLYVYNILGSVAKLGLTWLSRRRLPVTDGILLLSDLSAPVEIIRDRWAIPHIYAANTEDLFFAQGFVHAQDRLWQLELNRRVGQGRLSELFGKVALDTDRTVRTFGFNRLAQADWDNASLELQQAILAYTKGINAFLNHPDSKLPVEFTLLKHKPEPWQPTDTVSFSRVMMWQLSHAWYGEIVRAEIAEKVGSERAAELEIHYPPPNPITLPSGIEFNKLDPNGLLQKATGPFLDRGKGSNAWVLHGQKSDTGHAVLCNDMHLSLSIPSLWYYAHLNSPDFHVTGVTLPGAPGVLVGHNANIAWGMTLAFTDCEDLFIEKFNPDNPHQYRFKDEWLTAEVISEVIHIKGEATPHHEEVIITHHGPVISDVLDDSTQHIAVNSMALRPGPSFTGWLHLNKASNWDDFIEAVRLIEAPQLNVSYADVLGNIGHWVSGKVPIRAKGDGSIPAPGWTGEYEWVGEVPFSEMPHALNPKQGYLVSCNHRLVPDDYPHFLGNVWMNGYRARYLEDVFASKAKLSMLDFKAMHLDVTCLPGQEFITHLTNLTSNDSDIELALKILKTWNGQLSIDSIGGTLYEVTRYHLLCNLLNPALGEALTLRLMGKGFHPLLLSSHEFYGHDTVTMLRLLNNSDSWWIKQAGGKDHLLKQSLKQAVNWLQTHHGADVNGWQWGEIHQAIFPHALGVQKPLDFVFNRGPVPIGGDTDTPCQTAFHVDDPYNNNAWAPSFRQIVDMGDLSRSLFVFPPGQSGHLGSPHYDDLINPWLQGEYLPQLWTRDQVEAEAAHKLRLVVNE